MQAKEGDVYKALNEGKVAQAEAMMKDVLAEHPNSAKAHFMMAQVLLAKGDKKSARAEFIEAQRLDTQLKFASTSLVYEMKEQLGLLETHTNTAVPAYVPPKQKEGSMGLWLGLGASMVLAYVIWRVLSKKKSTEAVRASARQEAYGQARPTSTFYNEQAYDMQARQSSAMATNTGMTSYAPSANTGTSSMMGNIATTAVGVGAGVLAGSLIADALSGKKEETGGSQATSPVSTPSVTPSVEQVNAGGWEDSTKNYDTSSGDSSWDSGGSDSSSSEW